MQRKPKRRTRERILETALALFNQFGAPGVTTTAIAAEMGISPGNLYYHFHSKEEIVETLFAAYRREIDATLAVPEGTPAHAEDIWLFLHLVFEAIWKHRFIYRDLNELLSRSRPLELQFKAILAHKSRTASSILEGLVEAGDLNASREEIKTMSTNMTLIATYWLSYEFARDPRAPQNGRTLARGAVHVLSLAAPYLEPKARALFDHLAQEYLS
ncbi:MAG: TetR/AcrR family transcriptional regulator [Kiloniellales bacterium]|nr:TetR/AcrR family transcriptional regulator [Kiloniellales bacterium]